MGKLHSPTKTPQLCDRDHMCNMWVRYRRGPTSASSTVNSRLTELGSATPFTCFYKQHTACCSKIKEMEISSWCPSNVTQLSTAFILSIHQLMYSCCPSDIAWLRPCLNPCRLIIPTMPAADISACPQIPSNWTRAKHTCNRHLSLTCTIAHPHSTLLIF